MKKRHMLRGNDMSGYETTSYETKKAISNVLLKIMERKDVKKISVTEITNECRMNRATFYYHFRNIYDLANWTIKDLTSEAYDGCDIFETWQSAVFDALNFIKNNKKKIKAIYFSLGKHNLREGIYVDICDMIRIVMYRHADYKIFTEEEMDMITQFYSEAFLKMVGTWIENDMAESPESLIAIFDSILAKQLVSVFADK